jgi:hypothetical protein
MPTTLTHFYIGKMVYASLPHRIQEYIRVSRREYRAGCLGPDILIGLMTEKDPLLRNSGDTFHEESVFAGLCNAANYLMKNKDDTDMLAYLFGMLSHYAADSIIHPYVYAYMERRAEEGMAPDLVTCLHMLLESEMDAYVGKVRLKGKRANSFYRYSTHPDVKRCMKRFWGEINRHIFKIILTDDDIKNAYFRMKLIMFLCHRHRNGRIRFWLVRKMDKALKLNGTFVAVLRPRRFHKLHDYLNLGKSPYPALYKDPQSPMANYSFPEMIELAIQRGVELITKVYAHIFRGEILNLEDFKLTYNGNLSAEYIQAVEDGILEIVTERR